MTNGRSRRFRLGAALLTLVFTSTGVPFGAAAGAAEGTELVVNGGFESGDFSGWTVVDPAGSLLPWSVSGPGGGVFSSSDPVEGSFSAWNGLDGAGPVEFVLYQDVSIPPGGQVELRWIDRVEWDLPPGAAPRSAQVQIRDPGDNTVIEVVESFSTPAGQSAGDTGDVAHSVNIYAWAGSTIRVAFVQSGSPGDPGQAHFELDAVGLTWSDACATGDAPFADVPADSFAADDIDCIYGLGITTGTSPTTYAPAENVSREQMASFLARTYRATTGRACPAGQAPFVDVPADSFAVDDIDCIYALGITTGTSPTTYAPAEYVTREQMASFLVRLYESVGNSCPPGQAPFLDVPSDSFAADDIDCLSAIGITTGTSPTTYAPAEYVTREQMASFLARTHRAMHG